MKPILTCLIQHIFNFLAKIFCVSFSLLVECLIKKMSDPSVEGVTLTDTRAIYKMTCDVIMSIYLSGAPCCTEVHEPQHEISNNLTL